jgi:peptide/nickel transport system substrate-binding protein
VVREQLKEIGVDFRIKQLETPVWLKRVLAGDFQATMAYNDGTVDPDDLFSQLFLSKGPVNFIGYDNARVDTLITRARESLDDGERKRLYGDVRKQLFEDAPVFYVHYDTPNYLMGKDVVGATARPNLELRLDLVGYAK